MTHVIRETLRERQRQLRESVRAAGCRRTVWRRLREAGRFARRFRKIALADLLILDDWGPDRLSANQRRDLVPASGLNLLSGQASMVVSPRVELRQQRYPAVHRVSAAAKRVDIPTPAP